MQVAFERRRDPEERVDAGWPAPALEPRDGGLRRSDEVSEVGLREAASLAPLRHLAGDLAEEPALLGAGEARANSLEGLTHISSLLYIAIMIYRWSIAIALAVLAAATLYESLVALGAVDLGPLPGQGPPGEGFVLTVALFAMAVGVVVAVAAHRSPAVALLAPAAAAFLVARFYTFDPYYSPALRRMSDGGVVSPALVFLMVGLALCAALLTRVRSGAGVALTAPVVLGCALLAFVVGVGH